jgi:hypothetical protein
MVCLTVALTLHDSLNLVYMCPTGEHLLPGLLAMLGIHNGIRNGTKGEII